MRGDRLSSPTVANADWGVLSGVPAGFADGTDDAGGPAGGSLTGTYPSPGLAANSVGVNQIGSGTFLASDIAPDADTGQFAIPPNAIDGSEVADDTLTGSDIDESTLGGLVRIAGDTSANTTPDGDVLTAEITAPSAGFLYLVSSVDLFREGSIGDHVGCRLHLDDATVAGSNRLVRLRADLEALDSGGDSHFHGKVNDEEDCVTNAVAPVEAGAHVVDLNMDTTAAGTVVESGALNVLFAPDGTGG